MAHLTSRLRGAAQLLWLERRQRRSLNFVPGNDLRRAEGRSLAESLAAGRMVQLAVR